MSIIQIYTYIEPNAMKLVSNPILAFQLLLRLPSM